MSVDNVLVFPDEKALVVSFTSFFKSLVEKKNDRFLLALSGGNTPKKWFDYLATNEKDWSFWDLVYFYWGDERCVLPESGESNFGMTDKHLFKKITRISPDHINRIRGEVNPVEAASEYEKDLRQQLPLADGIPQFDLVVLGLGEDGHTASIFPHQLDLWYDEKLCVVASHPITGQHRISLTGKVINKALQVAFLVTGKNKCNRVEEILLRGGTTHLLPAGLVNPDSSPLQWFLDEEAGKQTKS